VGATEHLSATIGKSRQIKDVQFGRNATEILNAVLEVNNKRAGLSLRDSTDRLIARAFGSR
jgi:hypothetical protein